MNHSKYVLLDIKPHLWSSCLSDYFIMNVVSFQGLQNYCLFHRNHLSFLQSSTVKIPFNGQRHWQKWWTSLIKLWLDPYNRYNLWSEKNNNKIVCYHLKLTTISILFNQLSRSLAFKKNYRCRINETYLNC